MVVETLTTERGAEKSPEKYKKRDHEGHLFACILPIRTSKSCHSPNNQHTKKEREDLLVDGRCESKRMSSSVLIQQVRSLWVQKKVTQSYAEDRAKPVT